MPDIERGARLMLTEGASQEVRLRRKRKGAKSYAELSATPLIGAKTGELPERGSHIVRRWATSQPTGAWANNEVRAIPDTMTREESRRILADVAADLWAG